MKMEVNLSSMPKVMRESSSSMHIAHDFRYDKKELTS
jgi:hypothetical protein